MGVGGAVGGVVLVVQITTGIEEHHRCDSFGSSAESPPDGSSCFNRHRSDVLFCGRFGRKASEAGSGVGWA